MNGKEFIELDHFYVSLIECNKLINLKKERKYEINVIMLEVFCESM